MRIQKRNKCDLALNAGMPLMQSWGSSFGSLLSSIHSAFRYREMLAVKLMSVFMREARSHSNVLVKGFLNKRKGNRIINGEKIQNANRNSATGDSAAWQRLAR